MTGEVIQVIRCECPRCNHKHLARVNCEKLNKTLDSAIEELEREIQRIWDYYRENPEAWIKEDSQRNP